MSLTPETELALRQHLWLSHGHKGQYGDDGEMQCGECGPLGMHDYKREPLEKVVQTAIEARRVVNLAALQAAAPDVAAIGEQFAKIKRIREVYPVDQAKCPWCGVRRGKHNFDCPVPDVDYLLKLLRI